MKTTTPPPFRGTCLLGTPPRIRPFWAAIGDLCLTGALIAAALVVLVAIGHVLVSAGRTIHLW
jgi:hypothetical protein